MATKQTKDIDRQIGLAVRQILVTRGRTNVSLQRALGISEAGLRNKLRGDSAWLWSEIMILCDDLDVFIDSTGIPRAVLPRLDAHQHSAAYQSTVAA